jgi:hypothetical protein
MIPRLSSEYAGSDSSHGKRKSFPKIKDTHGWDSLQHNELLFIGRVQAKSAQLLISKELQNAMGSKDLKKSP